MGVGSSWGAEEPGQRVEDTVCLDVASGSPEAAAVLGMGWGPACSRRPGGWEDAVTRQES